MLILIGTVPGKTGLYIGNPKIKGNFLEVDSVTFPIERGTAVMAATALTVCDFYGLKQPVCILGADSSDGAGTDLMFQEVNSRLEKYHPSVVTLHYLFPKIAYGSPFISKINSLAVRPQLIADAGGMYLAKTIDCAAQFDVFTPDQGEVYFLADDFAPHPLYVRPSLLDKNLSTDYLMELAYKQKTTAKTTVVKGAVDYIYENGVKKAQLDKPNIPAMEAIGGTGDTITGMISVLRFKKENNADYKALVLNRLIGNKIKCTAATQIAEFIQALPKALEDYEKQ